MGRIVPICWFWRFSLDRIKVFILGESRLAKGWREGVIVRVAMMVEKHGCAKNRFVLARWR